MNKGKIMKVVVEFIIQYKCGFKGSRWEGLEHFSGHEDLVPFKTRVEAQRYVNAQVSNGCNPNQLRIVRRRIEQEVV
jgi:hypothetical protein